MIVFLSPQNARTMPGCRCACSGSVELMSTDVADGFSVTTTARLDYRFGSIATLLIVSDGDVYPARVPADCERVVEGVKCFVGLLGNTSTVPDFSSMELEFVFPFTATRVVATVTLEPTITETNPADNTATLQLR